MAVRRTWAADPFIAVQQGVPMVRAILAHDPDITFGSEAEGAAWTVARLAEGADTPELAGRVAFPTADVGEFARGVELTLRSHVHHEHKIARRRPRTAPPRVVPGSGSSPQGGSIPSGATKTKEVV